MFYGWKIVAVTFCTHFISVGFIFYSYGIFLTELEREFGGSRFLVSSGLAIMHGVVGLFSPTIGRMLDRHSIRQIMMLGVASLGIGFVLASRVQAIWQFYVVLATMLGLGAAMMGQLPGATLVSNWFVARRGMALGIATMGISLSGLVMPPLGSRLIDVIGWRWTFVVYGVVAFAVILPLVALYVINRPEDIGERPDGVRREGDEARSGVRSAAGAAAWAAARRDLTAEASATAGADQNVVAAGEALELETENGEAVGVGAEHAQGRLTRPAEAGEAGGVAGRAVNGKPRLSGSAAAGEVAVARGSGNGGGMETVGAGGGVSGTGDSPAEGSGASRIEATPAPPVELPAKVILSDRNYWGITLAIALNFCANGAILTHIPAHGMDLGYGRDGGAWVLAAIAGMGVVGKVVFGWIVDRMSKKLALAISSGFQLTGVVLILLAQNYTQLIGAGLIFGLGMGGIVPLWGALLGAAFGRRVFGRVMGMMTPSMLPVQLLGVPFAGWIHDVTGGYRVAFIIFVGIYAAAIGVLQLVKLPDVEPED